MSYIHNSSLYLLGLIGFVTCIVSDIHHSSLYLLGLIGFVTCIVSDIHHSSLYLLDLVGFVTCIVSNIHHNSLHSLDLVWFVILLCLISTTVHCIYSALLGLLLVLCLILYPPQFIVFTRPYWVFFTCIVSNIHHNLLHSLDLVRFVILLCLISTTVHCIYWTLFVL